MSNDQPSSWPDFGQAARDAQRDAPASDSVPSPGDHSSDSFQTVEALPAPEALGAIDIVAAFTALRHELKLQVGNGRELRDLLGNQLQQWEQQMAANQGPLSAESPDIDACRKLADVVAEMEEGLRRAVESLPPRPTARDAGELDPVAQFDHAVAQASWLARRFSSKLLGEARGLLANASQDRETVSATHQGLELLLQRIERLMEKCAIKRVDVLRMPFDAETMRAVDVIDAPATPSAHVAEQLRPAYFWRGDVLRYADVRLAR